MEIEGKLQVYYLGTVEINIPDIMKRLDTFLSEYEIEEEEFKEWFREWSGKFESKEFEREYEKSLPKIPEEKIDEIEEKIDVYLKEKHSKKDTFNFIKNIYKEAGYSDEQVEEMILPTLIFRVITSKELYYLMEI